MVALITEYPQFFTATNLEWKPLLKTVAHKEIVISSLRFLVENKRIKLFAFVIMPNHLHLIWQMQPLIHPKHVQRDFLKYTAQQMKYHMQQHYPEMLQAFFVGAADRMYQFWERNPLSIELRSYTIFQQKLDYIHFNPVRAGLCKYPEEYLYSSAQFYRAGVDNWGFLSHYAD
ncbi:REP-associated tyrosine transposase [Niabella hibiscisoli]|uniref:REP-associated tyrosine transposase n=1 Tax=Niabella hibiscisoli TaxID=1825928 RepID=UPI001F119154|nr:transposase [Niabella hibiscisoli]MCH5720508.1 transposase [Niabella hibiscisoli]